MTDDISNQYFHCDLTKRFTNRPLGGAPTLLSAVCLFFIIINASKAYFLTACGGKTVQIRILGGE